MVVAHVSGECARSDELPERLESMAVGDIAEDYSALRAEECLVGRPGDDIRPFGQRILKVLAEQTEHMSTVVHHERPLRIVGPELGVNEFDDVPDRLDMDDHAAPEDDKVRLSLQDERLGRLDVNRVGKIPPRYEVVHCRPLGPRIMGDVVLQAPPIWALRWPPLLRS